MAVVRVEESPAGDASGPEFPRAETNRQRPTDLPEVAGNVRTAGLVNSVGSVGLSPHAEKTLEPLEHMVHTQTDPAGQFSAVGTQSPSDFTLLAQLAHMLQGALSAQMFILQIRIR